MSAHDDEVQITFEIDEDWWTFDLVWRGRRVGYARCTLQDGRLLLGDFKVEDKAFVPWPFAHSFLIGLGLRRRPRNFRGKGHGSRLLDRVLEEADRRGITEVWGSVVSQDTDANPRLLDWYRSRGFQILEPDGECLGHADWKIVRKRGGRSDRSGE